MVKRLRDSQVSKFKKADNPIDVDHQIQDMKIAFEVTQRSEVEKAKLGAHYLSSRVRQQWKSIQVEIDLETYTWTQFKSQFYSRYFSTIERTMLK